MDFTDLRVWAAAVIVLQFVVAAASWLGRKSFATTENLLAVNKILQDQLDERERTNTLALHRIELLELKIKSLPDFDDLDRLREAIGKLTESVSGLNGEIKGIDDKFERTSDAVTRIEQHLLSRSAA